MYLFLLWTYFRVSILVYFNQKNIKFKAVQNWHFYIFLDHLFTTDTAITQKFFFSFHHKIPSNLKNFPLNCRNGPKLQIRLMMLGANISLHYLSRGTGSLNVLLDFASLAMLCTTHNGFKFFFLSINYFVYLHFQDIILSLRQTTWHTLLLSDYEWQKTWA